MKDFKALLKEKHKQGSEHQKEHKKNRLPNWQVLGSGLFVMDRCWPEGSAKTGQTSALFISYICLENMEAGFQMSWGNEARSHSEYSGWQNQSSKRS